MAENKSRFQSNQPQPQKSSGGRFSGASNQSTKRKVNYKGGVEDTSDNYFLLLVGFVLLFLPLIIKAKVYDPKLAQFDWFSNTTKSIDVFLYWKEFYFGLALAVMVICLLASFFNGKRQFTFQPIFIPLFIYGGLAVLSTIFSEYRSFGISGIFEQFESVFCLLGYVVLVYYIVLYVRHAGDVHALINVLAIGALIIGVIGTFQGLHLDFFRGSLGKSIIATEQVPASSLSFSFMLGQAYVTLYNPNYVGVYCVLLIPVFAILTPFAKKTWEKGLYAAVVVTLLLSMFAAQFKAGIVCLAVVGVMVLFLMRKSIIKKWFIAVPGVVLVVALFVIVDLVNGHVYSTGIKNAFQISKTQQPALTEIETLEDKITFTYQGQSYSLTADAVDAGDGTLTYSYFAVTGADGTNIPVVPSEDQTYYVIADENLAGFSITGAPSISGFCMTVDGKQWNFIKREDGYKYYNLYGRETVIETADSAVFTGYESFASRRGFIWAKTIPMLKKYILLGSGADTFSIVFPQHDYVSLYNNGYGEQLISKPHCWYLQVAVQTGVLSLIALLVFYGMYFVQSIRLYSKKIMDSYLAQVGVAIFVGTIGYMVAGITNDSSITVAPVFWAVMGIGIAVNTMVKNERRQEAENKK